MLIQNPKTKLQFFYLEITNILLNLIFLIQRMASSLSQLNLFSLILQLGIVNRDHLDLSVVMEVDAKSEWLESGLAYCARLSSSCKNLVLTIWKQKIDKVQLHAQIMLTFLSSTEKYFQLKQGIYQMFLLQSWN